MNECGERNGQEIPELMVWSANNMPVISGELSEASRRRTAQIHQRKFVFSPLIVRLLSWSIR